MVNVADGSLASDHKHNHKNQCPHHPRAHTHTPLSQPLGPVDKPPPPSIYQLPTTALSSSSKPQCLTVGTRSHPTNSKQVGFPPSTTSRDHILTGRSRGSHGKSQPSALATFRISQCIHIIYFTLLIAVYYARVLH